MHNLNRCKFQGDNLAGIVYFISPIYISLLCILIQWNEEGKIRRIFTYKTRVGNSVIFRTVKNSVQVYIKRVGNLHYRCKHLPCECTIYTALVLILHPRRVNLVLRFLQLDLYLKHTKLYMNMFSVGSY